MVYQTLSPDDIKRLHWVLKEKHGNMKIAKRKSGLTTSTLLRAVEGLPIHPESKKSISTTLLS